MTLPVCLITGASRGIGRATALLAAEAGYHVIVNFNGNKAAADEVVRLIQTQSGKATAIQADVAEEADVLRLLEAADHIGPLKALVNNAGVVDAAQRVEEFSLSRIQRMFAINVFGTMLCAREAVKRMSTKHGGQGGSIVNVSSVASLIGSPNEYVDYASAKAAVDTFTLGLAKEVALEGIRVNAVRPGIIQTDIHASGGQPDRADRLKHLIPMQRAGEADEIAQSILFLLSDKASYTTGSFLNVSGGRL